MCSGYNPKPTEDDARRATEKIYASYAQVSNFHKTNAHLREVQGVQIYEINYEAEIQYTKSGVEQNFMGRVSAFTETENPKPLDKAFGTIRMKGDRRYITGLITFEKTRGGWRPASGKIPQIDLDATLGIPPTFFLFLVLIGIGGSILWIWAIIDCATKEPQGIDKLVWIIVIVFTHWGGALIYLLFRHRKRISDIGSKQPSRSSNQPGDQSKGKKFSNRQEYERWKSQQLKATPTTKE
jgi:hypothetical protein